MFRLIVNKLRAVRDAYTSAKLDFFVLDKDRQLFHAEKDARLFFIASDEHTYKALCEKYHLIVDPHAGTRFQEGDCFCIITQNDVFGCRGWYSTAPRSFFISEIQQHTKIPENAVVLYDFYTDPNCRRKGFYFDLLRRIADRCSGKTLIIYALDENTASKNAIRKAGFSFALQADHRKFKSFAQLLCAERPAQ